MKDEQKLLKAIKCAEINNFCNARGRLIRLGAAIYNGNNFIASNVNQNKTHPLMQYYNQQMPFKRIPYLHAEIATLLAARWEIGKDNLKNCTIYVARKLNNGNLGNARPCPACWKALKDAGIRKVVYTTEYGFAIEFIR